MEGGEWRFLFLDHVKAPGQGSSPEGAEDAVSAGSPKLVPHRPQAGLSMSTSRNGWETAQVPRHLEIKVSPTLHLSSINPYQASCSPGPEHLGSLCFISRPKKGHVRSSVRMERQRPVQWTPGMLTQEWREAWVKLGRQGEREETGLGASMELHVGPFCCSSVRRWGCDNQDHLGDCT